MHTLEHLLDQPRQIRADVSLLTLQAFIDYYNLHNTPQSAIFATDRVNNELTAIIDFYQRGEPSWCKHRVTEELRAQRNGEVPDESVPKSWSGKRSRWPSPERISRSMPIAPWFLLQLRESSLRTLGEIVMKAITLAAYERDVQRFVQWGGAIPTSPKRIADYLNAHAPSHKLATLVRWLVSLGKAHQTTGMEDPTKSAVVTTVLQGIKQQHGSAQRSVARLTRTDVEAVIRAIDVSVRPVWR
ncbi:MAG: YfdQ family protein [Magnetococcus sp. YQC-9]